MECCSSLIKLSSSFNTTLCNSPLTCNRNSSGCSSCSRSRKRKKESLGVISAFSYQKFVHFALDETKRHTHLVPSPLQDNFSSMRATDGKTELQMLSFRAPKIRLLRSLCIEGSETAQAWLALMDQASEDTDASRIISNSEAQHRYLTWRAEKDPGRRILKKFIGDTLAKDLVRDFLFNGINELGRKTFLDYFPEYRCKDGSINEKRSMAGKSFENRPWDARGDFVGDKV